MRKAANSHVSIIMIIINLVSRCVPPGGAGPSLSFIPCPMRVTLYFDVVSPYTALAWKVLMRYKPIWEFELVLKPVFLGGVMKVGDNPCPPPSLTAAADPFLSLVPRCRP